MRCPSHELALFGLKFIRHLIESLRNRVWIVAGEIFSHRFGEELASRLPCTPCQLLGTFEQVVWDRDSGLHTISITFLTAMRQPLTLRFPRSSVRPTSRISGGAKGRAICERKSRDALSRPRQAPC